MMLKRNHISELSSYGFGVLPSGRLTEVGKRVSDLSRFIVTAAPTGDVGPCGESLPIMLRKSSAVMLAGTSERVVLVRPRTTLS